MSPATIAPPPAVAMHQRRVAVDRFSRAASTLLLVPILTALFGVALLRPFVEDHASLLLALGIAGVCWLAAVALARGGAADLRIVVAGAIALRLLGLAGAPQLSDDVYRYAWEGELVAAGISPYAYAPDAPELEVLRASRADLYERINHPEVSAAYPPLAQGVFAAARRTADAFDFEGWRPVVTGLRVLFALCDLLVLVPLVLLLRRRGLPDGLAVVWGWCPLVAVEFAGSGHFDALGILLLVGALCVHDPASYTNTVWRGARATRRELAALALLAAATLVKLLPVCAAPFMARSRSAVRIVFFAALVVAGFLPIVLGLEGGMQGLGRGLGEYGLRWEHSGLLYGHVEALLRFAGLENNLTWFDARRVGRALVGAAWIALGVWLWRRRVPALESTAVLVGAFLVLSPTLHPWYIAWIVPFLALFPRASFLWLAAASSVLYFAPVLYELEGRYEVPFAARLVLVVPFWLFLLVELRADVRDARA